MLHHIYHFIHLYVWAREGALTVKRYITASMTILFFMQNILTLLCLYIRLAMNWLLIHLKYSMTLDWTYDLTFECFNLTCYLARFILGDLTKHNLLGNMSELNSTQTYAKSSVFVMHSHMRFERCTCALLLIMTTNRIPLVYDLVLRWSVMSLFELSLTWLVTQLQFSLLALQNE